MTALSLTVAVFASFWLIGLALLTAVRAKASQLRVALTAPVVGASVAVLPLFILSYAGFPIQEAAWPVAVTLVVASAAIIVWRRPPVPRATYAVAALCLLNLALLGRPMLEFGFDWVGNGNADMAYYTLSATQLLDHGLLGPIDFDALAENRSYPTMSQLPHEGGARPGANIMIAALAALTGLMPYQVYMPLILALSMCLVCAAAALAMQAARKAWAAALAAALVAVAPFAGFGVLQQLLPQTWGLAMAAALFAWLMRPQIHRTPGASSADLVVISVIVVAFVLVYSELAALLVLAYALFLLTLVVQRRIEFRPLLRLLGVPLVTLVLVHNFYLVPEIEYVLDQATRGTAAGGGTTGGEVPLFGYALVPSALPGVFGFQLLPADPSARLLDLSIIASFVVLAVVLLLSVLTARRAAAPSVVLLALGGFGLILALQESDFGVYKIYMYVQPFLAAAIAVWLSMVRRFQALAGAAFVVALVVVLQAKNANAYVEASRDPVDLHNGSSPHLVPYFGAVFERAREPVVTVAENPTLAALEAMIAGDRPLHFIARIWSFGSEGWMERSFDMLRSEVPRRNTFQVNRLASTHLSGGRCRLILPTGTQTVLNRLKMPEGSPDLQARRCGEYPQNTLVFIPSELGESFYLPQNRKNVAAYQLEPDPAYPGRTFAGFGRYALLRVLNPSPTVRLVLDMTTTFRQDGRNDLPPATVIGDTHVEMPLVGRGTARVVSPAVKPQVVDGVAYLVLDMGVQGRLIDYPRDGISGLWGRDVPLDVRHLTSWVRGISLITDDEYAKRAVPAALKWVARDLADQRVEYSGVYEDGWVGERAYALLGGGPTGTFVLRADVLPRPAGQHLEVLVDGRTAYSRPTPPGLLTVHVPLPASDRPRHVELRWAGETRLRPPDRRLAAARLRYLGMTPPPAVVRIPADLDRVGFTHSGIYADGWSSKVARATLRGGGPGNLVIRADVPLPGQRVRVLVNSRQVALRSVAPGRLDLRVPLGVSAVPRRVEVRWAVAAPISADDDRIAAARFTFMGTPRPPALVRVPQGLSDPALMTSGVYADGWLGRRSSLLLRGGRTTASLVIRALVPQARGQRLVVRVGGRTVASMPVKPGELEFRVPVPPGPLGRRVELLWATTVALAKPDTRRAAARLLLARVTPARAATTVRRQDLADPRLAYAGIYRDGWMERRVRLVVAGGRAARLRVRTQVVVPGQQVTVLVDGRAVAVEPVERGVGDIRVPIPPSSGLRSVELRWAKAARLAANDPRAAAALLRSISVEPVKPMRRIAPGDLDEPSVAYSGIYADGWLRKDARVTLAGGATAKLTLRTQVVVPGQRLEMVVNGRPVVSQPVPLGDVTVSAPISPTGRARLIELRWAKDAALSSSDRRRAAALLRTISISDVSGPQRVRIGQLDDRNVVHSGIYRDGWMERRGRLVVAAGPAGTLTLRAQVVLAGQALEVAVNRRVVASQSVQPGEAVVRVAVPAAAQPRLVEFRWSRTARLAANDPRSAAARLVSVAVAAATPTARPVGPADTTLQASLAVSAEVPPTVTPPADARGTFRATLDGRRLRWRLAVSNLSGQVVAAVVRAGGPGAIGARLVPLCQPCTTSASGTIDLTAAQAAQLARGDVYVNVGTPSNPTGEIRGQISRR